MSGYQELAELGITVRPLSEPKPAQGGRFSPFSAALTSTIEILATELRSLQAERIILELGLRERDIRLDGMPRADARPTHDGVALSFGSKFGPLRYATAEYTGRWTQPAWQANLRAIALAMQALRAVDRYGVSKRGEQYQGWRAIPESTGGDLDIRTAEQAWMVICEAAGVPVDSSPLVNGQGRREIIAAALKAAHPDTGGDADKLRRVIKARDVLNA